MLELDVTNQGTWQRWPSGCPSTGGLDGVVHSIGFAPQDALGGNFLNTPWESVATAVQVSAFSLKSLTMACLPLMNEGGSVVGLTFDATIAWPQYDWMGPAKAALEATSRYLARDLGKQHPLQPGLGGPDQDDGRQVHPRLHRLEDVWDTAPRSAGTSPTPSRPAAASSRCSRTGSRRPPARSSTSTAACTRSVPDLDDLPYSRTGLAQRPTVSSRGRFGCPALSGLMVILPVCAAKCDTSHWQTHHV